jgi:phenylpropionate dioxygenase-like ring-hydroxylating dioxygenase large terminal subunit
LSSLGEAEIVLYRSVADGRPIAMIAHCAHAGCHLRHGTVTASGLRCALHHRVIGPEGRFVTQGGGQTVPLRQPCFPTRERFGAIFVFAGEREDFELPSPQICETGEVATRSLADKPIDLPWSALIANGMDIDHLQAVHGRALRETPSLTAIDAYRMRLDYASRITGSQLSDKVMKWLSGDRVQASITCIGGTMMIVESEIGRRRTFILLSMRPRGGQATTIAGVAGIARTGSRLSAKVAALATAWLFRAFLQKDIGILASMRWHAPAEPRTLGDRLTRELCHYFASMPAFEPARLISASAPGVGAAFAAKLATASRMGGSQI